MTIDQAVQDKYAAFFPLNEQRPHVARQYILQCTSPEHAESVAKSVNEGCTTNYVKATKMPGSKGYVVLQMGCEDTLLPTMLPSIAALILGIDDGAKAQLPKERHAS
jgi:hypothetical protein